MTTCSSIYAQGDKGNGIIIDFDQVDLNEALKVLIKEGLHASYVLSPRVSGRITIHSIGEIKKDQLLPLIEAILRLNNLSIVKKDHIYYIVPQQEAPGLTEIGIGEGVGIYLFPLEHIRTDKAASTIKPLLGPTTQIIPESYSNTLIVVGYPKDVEKIKTLIKAIDIDLFTQVKFKMFILQYIKVDEVYSVLKQIFKEGPKPEIRPVITFIPFKSMNALLVLTIKEDLLNQVEGWIKELDVKPEEAAMHVYVYPIENGDAEEIANLLKQLFGKKVEKRPGKVIVPAKKAAPTAPTEELIAEVKIIPDKINNFLIIKATPPDYHIIERVIKELDIIPRQVSIETVLAEITLTKSIAYGVEWFIKHRGQKYIGNVSLSEGVRFSMPEGVAAEGLPTGFSYSLFTTPGQLRALISTLASISEVNILSTPLILVTDNTESSIKVGEEWPYTKETTVTTTGVPITSVEYREVGILLTVKPHISSTGLVKMELTQEISSVLPEAEGVGGNPAFMKRQAKTSLVVQNGQTVVLGGLFKTEKTRTTSGIPLLKDIPLLGFLFGKKSWETTKTELLIALTPHVIRTREEAEAVHKEFLEKIEELKRRMEVKKGGK